MKKTIFTLLLIPAVVAVHAQTSFGIQLSGGMQSAAISTSENISYDKKPKASVGAGVFADLQLSDQFSIRPTLQYMQKGVKLSYSETADGETVSIKLNTSLHFLELPVTAVYHGAGEQFSWYAGAGPTIGYGVSGKIKAHYKLTPLDIEMSDEEDAFKKEEDGGSGFSRFDAGLHALAGVQFSQGFFIQLGYQHSLKNLASGTEGGDSFKCRNLQLTVGITLGKK